MQCTGPLAAAMLEENAFVLDTLCQWQAKISFSVHFCIVRFSVHYCIVRIPQLL